MRRSGGSLSSSQQRARASSHGVGRTDGRTRTRTDGRAREADANDRALESKDWELSALRAALDGARTASERSRADAGEHVARLEVNTTPWYVTVCHGMPRLGESTSRGSR